MDSEMKPQQQEQSHFDELLNYFLDMLLDKDWTTNNLGDSYTNMMAYHEAGGFYLICLHKVTPNSLGEQDTRKSFRL